MSKCDSVHQKIRFKVKVKNVQRQWRESKEGKPVVQTNSMVMFHITTSLWVMFGLSTLYFKKLLNQHFSKPWKMCIYCLININQEKSSGAYMFHKSSCQTIITAWKIFNTFRYVKKIFRHLWIWAGSLQKFPALLSS